MGIKNGDLVKVDYEGRFENGVVFDSSRHGDHSHPLEFVVGNREVIKGFDEAVIDMEKNEEKEFNIEPEEAYGARKEELVRKISRESFPLEQEPKAGMMLMMKTPDGMQIPVLITHVDPKTITLDMNHPLAGKRLIFKIKIVEIEHLKDDR